MSQHYFNDIHDFYITLVSTDGDVRNNTNTLTDFTNFMPKVLNLSSNNWTVAMHSIYIHNEVKSPRIIDAQYLKVFCNEINTEGQLDTCISTFARPTRPNIKRIFFQPKILEYYPLNSYIIEKLRIYIKVGSESRTVYENFELHSGQPTIVTLHFKKTMAFPTKVLRINSGEAQALTLFPENNAHEFRAMLGQSFRFDPQQGEWEVGVSSITYQPDFTPKLATPYTIKLLDQNAKLLLAVETSLVPDVNLNTPKYVNYINDIFSLLATKGQVLLDEQERNKKSYYITTGQSKRTLYVHLPFALFYNIGFRDFKTTDQGGNFIKRVTAFGQIEYYLKIAKTVDCDTKLDPLAYNPEVGVLYCDFVKPSIVGGQEVPLLKTFPIIRNQNTDLKRYITYEALWPEYYPLSKYDLSIVKFSLRDFSGSLLPFRNKDSNVIITLLLRYKPFTAARFF